MTKDYLWRVLGKTIQNALLDDKVNEIILNPDGQLWLVHEDSGAMAKGSLVASQAEAFVHGLAQYHQSFLNDKKPYFDGTLPFHGERVNITIPPMTEEMAFNIRKHHRDSMPSS